MRLKNWVFTIQTSLKVNVNMKILLQSVLTRSPAQLGEMQLCIQMFCPSLLTYFAHIEDSLTKNFTFGFTTSLDLLPLIFIPVLFIWHILPSSSQGMTIVWHLSSLLTFLGHEPSADWTENERQSSQFPKKNCESPKENYWARVH